MARSPGRRRTGGASEGRGRVAAWLMAVSDDEHDFGEDDDAQPEGDGKIVDRLEAVDPEGFRPCR